MLDRCCFFDPEDIDSSHIINSLKWSISSHSESFCDDSNLFESHIVLCILDNTFTKLFSSIWRTLLCSLESKCSCTTSCYSISLRISKGDMRIIRWSIYMQNPWWDLNILLLFWCCHTIKYKLLATSLLKSFSKIISFTTSVIALSSLSSRSPAFFSIGIFRSARIFFEVEIPIPNI